MIARADETGGLSLDLPGGKRRLGETAWEAACRELAELGLAVKLGVDALEGAGGAVAAGAAAFRAERYAEGDSTRFFVLRGELAPEPNKNPPPTAPPAAGPAP